MRHLILALIFSLVSYCGCYGFQESKVLTEMAKIDSLYKEEKFKSVVHYCITLLNNNKKIPKETVNKYISLLADSYLQLGDYNNAVSWYRKQLELNKIDPQKLADTYLIIADIYVNYYKKEFYISTIQELIEVQQIVDKEKLNANYTWRIKTKLGIIYHRLNDLKNAKTNLDDAIKYATLLKDVDKIQASYLNNATLYHDGIETSKSNLEILKNAYLKALNYDGKYSYALFKSLGVVYYLQNNFEEALNYHNKGLESLTNIPLKSYRDLPEINKINTNDYGKIIDILFEKAYAWIKLSKQSDRIDNLNYALKTVNLADQLLDKISDQVTDEDSQLYWREFASSFYNLGATICFTLNLTNKASYFLEKNKSLLLLDYTIENKLKKLLPEHLLLKELKIKKEKDSIYNIKTTTPSNALENLYLQKKLQLDSYSDSLKKEFPEVYKVAQSKNTYSLTEIRKQIPPQTVYLTFIWDKEENQFDALHAMAITKDTAYIYKIIGLSKMDSLVSNYKSYLKKPLSKTDEFRKFQNISSQLYYTLFPDNIINDFIKNNKNLVVFPDGELQNIPFESLITKEHTTNYLIETHNIHYAYSMSYLIENSKIERNAKKDFVGYAPVNFEYDKLNTLPKTIKELSEIKDEIGGENYLNEFATKPSFLKQSSSCKIIHLATHSNTSENPWIGFKNDKLLLHELYSYKNQADLVYLNSCNSSLGKIKSGEGVYSLARGFFYSGSKSVISSLWNINDKSNQEITNSFYKHIKKGKTKSAALRHAKLDYLKTHSLSEASPYYWSSLVLIGDDSKIRLNDNILYYIVLSALLLLVLIFILKKIKIMGNKS